MNTMLNTLRAGQRMAAILIGVLFLLSANAAEFSAQQLETRTLHRRAVEAAIWGMPIVSVEAMREAGFSAAKANFNDVLYFTRPMDAKFQFKTPNNSTLYVWSNVNTQRDGPMVVEIPAGEEGVSIFGTMLDAWQVPLTDVGAKGDDQGKGGKYLLLPPNYQGDVPDGYTVLHSTTNNDWFLLRMITQNLSEEELHKAVVLLKQIKVYPLSAAANVPGTRFIDATNIVLNGAMEFDASFYTRLARMVNEEPVHERDLAMMGLLRSLGIEKGKEFAPDANRKKILDSAAREVQEIAITDIVEGYPLWWNDRKWRVLADKAVFLGGTTFLFDNYLAVPERGKIFYTYYAPVKKIGEATFYLKLAEDRDGSLLEGDKTYRLNVPASVPVREFWSVIVYDLDRATFIPESPRVGLSSLDAGVTANADGSTDVYFGPKAPAGKAANWIPTNPGGRFFMMFRFYGPEKPLFEKTWKLTDLAVVK